MKYVGLYSFAGCKSLTNINLEHVEEIADYAFTSSEILQKSTYPMLLQSVLVVLQVQVLVAIINLINY